MDENDTARRYRQIVKKLHVEMTIILRAKKILSKLQDAEFKSFFQESQLRAPLWNDFPFGFNAKSRHLLPLALEASSETRVILILLSVKALSSDESSLVEFLIFWQRRQGLLLELLISEKKAIRSSRIKH